MSDSILTVIADNPALMEAVKKAVLSKFGTSFSDVDGHNDIELGQRVRACIAGRRMVEEAFQEIARHKSTPKPQDKRNEAR